MAINVSMDSIRQQRTMRMPQHTWFLKSKPWQIVPFMCAPVLPGETLKNVRFQSRVVTDPIVNKLIGWWKEYYFFYVKHRDLNGNGIDISSTLQSMMLDMTTDVSGIRLDGGSVPFYTYDDGVLFVEACYRACVREYFREGSEPWNVASIGDYAAARVSQENFLQSAMNDDQIGHGTALADAAQTPEGLEQARMAWEYLRQNNLTKMDYEDFLRSYGVKGVETESHKPELLRYVREWSYPVNTVEPTTGVPTSAVSWSIAERADKDRFFKEPGFIFGVTVARPKVYLSPLSGAGVGMLDNAFAWLPALMRDEVYSSLKRFAAGDGPLQSNTDDYWIDVRDLFLYGDQFVNHSIDATNNGIAIPTTALQRKYPTEAMAEAFFVDDAGTDPDDLVFIREDGVANLSVLGTQVDAT